MDCCEKEGIFDILSQEARRDLNTGIRTRRMWTKILANAEKKNISESQVRALIGSRWIAASDEERKTIAGAIGVDWEGLTEFMVAIMPLIMEMMASCPA